MKKYMFVLALLLTAGAMTGLLMVYNLSGGQKHYNKNQRHFT